MKTTLLTLAALLLAPLSAYSATGMQLWLEYVKAPDTHPNIPNCSYAGYHYGEVPVPFTTPANAKGLVNVKDHGAKGDGVADDTKAILAAIASTPSPGSVYFPAGTYLINDIIRITRSHLVLFGDGSGKSILYFKKSLTAVLGAYAFNHAPGENRWSNHGGMIWTEPKGAWNADGSYKYRDPGESGLDAGWIRKEKLADITINAVRGQDKVTLHMANPAAGLPAGVLLMTWKNDANNTLLVHMGGHPQFKDYAWRTAPVLAARDWDWMVEIKEVIAKNGADWTVRLRQPLRIDIRPEWKVTLNRPGNDTSDPNADRYIEEVGIESLKIQMPVHATVKHMHYEGYSGPYYERAFNCWIRDVVAAEVDNGFCAGFAKCMTWKDTKVTASNQHHHAYYLRMQDHDCLVQGFQTDRQAREGLSIAKRSSGCAFSDGNMLESSFDSHLGMPFDVIRTTIILGKNNGKQSGPVYDGPRNGARVVHWNIPDNSGTGRIVYQPSTIPMGALVGIQKSHLFTGNDPQMPHGGLGTIIADENKLPAPVDLYEAQRALRLGK
jgi:hypothetical protein